MKLNRTTVILAAVLGIAAAGKLSDHSDGRSTKRGSDVVSRTESQGGPTTPGTSPKPKPAPSASKPASGVSRSSAIPAAAQLAVVVSITDGDTIRVHGVAPGAVLTSTAVTKVRLLEVDTPETVDPSQPVQCYGPEASAYLTKLIPVGTTIWVTRDQELLDRYGRTLLYLWKSNGLFVNREIARLGYGKAVLFAPNDHYIDSIRAAEAEARGARRGLWSGCTSSVNPLVSRPAPTPKPTPTATASSNCEPAYPDLCLPPAAGHADIDCGDITARRFRVLSPDPYRFDADHDGIGCESG